VQCTHKLTPKDVDKLPVYSKGKGKGKCDDVKDDDVASGSVGNTVVGGPALGYGGDGTDTLPMKVTMSSADDDKKVIGIISDKLEQLNDMGTIIDNQASLTTRLDQIQENIAQMTETMSVILSNQMYLVKKLKRNRVIEKSIGDSDIFENHDHDLHVVHGTTIVDAGTAPSRASHDTV